MHRPAATRPKIRDLTAHHLIPKGAGRAGKACCRAARRQTRCLRCARRQAPHVTDRPDRQSGQHAAAAVRARRLPRPTARPASRSGGAVQRSRGQSRRCRVVGAVLPSERGGWGWAPVWIAACWAGARDRRNCSGAHATVDSLGPDVRGNSSLAGGERGEVQSSCGDRGEVGGCRMGYCPRLYSTAMQLLLALL